MINQNLIKKKVKIIESLFQIPNKEGITVPFILNGVQSRFALDMTGRDIIVKARQEGFSSLIEAMFLVDCISMDNIRAVVIAHDKESTQKLFNRVKFYINNMKGAKPFLEYDSKSEITFPKTNSSFYIGTAGSKQFGRGDTIHRLHCSEVGFWETGRDILAGLMQAVPGSGQIVLESTGNGVGNFFHRRAKAALDGETNSKLHFFPWYAHSEYKIPPPAEFEFDAEDIEFQDTYSLEPSQTFWYLNKMREMMDGPSDDEGYKLFLQEYPTTFDEAFKFSGGKFFTSVERTDLSIVDKTSKYERVCKKPLPEHDYSIGIDIGGGVGLDYTVIQIIDLTEGEQVLEWRANLIQPEFIGPRVVEYGRRYNNATLIPESNNHGYLLIDYLKRNYQINKIFRQERVRTKGVKRSIEYGWFTSDKAKFHLCDHGRTVLGRGFKFYSRILEEELLSFEEKETQGESRVKRLSAPKGEHDDCIIAFMLALYGVSRLFTPKTLSSYEQPSEPVALSFTGARDLAIANGRGRKPRAGFPLGNGYNISGVV